VLAVIGSLKRSGTTSIVFVSQDADALAALADHVIVLDAGRIVDSGRPRQIFAPHRLDQLIRLGLAVPALAALAAGINTRLGTDFEFVTHEQTAASLIAGLSSSPRP
jgi:ABC-type glutathione transport system ATPase component